MGRIWAVARNTFVSSMRMKTAIFFMFLLVVLLPVLSLTTTGDGTLLGRLQSFVTYGLGLVTFLLSFLTIIVSCHTLSSDIKYKRIFTVSTKPIRRFEFVIGKALGVMLLDLLLLGVFSTIIYALIIQMPRFSEVADEQLTRLDNEFLTARASLKMSIDEDLVDTRARQAYDELLKTGQIDDTVSRKKVLAELRDAVKFSRHSAGPGGMVLWEFENVKPFDANETIFIRFKFNASQTPPDKNIYGTWYVGDYRQIREGTGQLQTPIYQIPRKDIVKQVHEFEVSAAAVADDGYLAIAFQNAPANGTTVIFPLEDGFEVLYKAGDFGRNFFNAVLIIMIRLFFLICLGVSLSTWLGFPVAVFFCFTVFFAGLVNGFVVQSFDNIIQQLSFFYKYIMQPIVWILPKFDEGNNINRYLVDARLIDYKVLILMAGSFLLKSIVLLFAGFIIFAKRELAKITV